MAEPKVAIVHDWMVSPGGGEKVVMELHKLWPSAPIYTAAFEPAKFPEFSGADIRTTWLNRIGLARRQHQLFALPRILAFKGLDLSGYDIVISSSTAEGKLARIGRHTLHICYCHTPTRYYWSDYDWYRKHPPFKGLLRPLASFGLAVLAPLLRRIDYRGAQNVRVFVANSYTVQERIKRYYDRDSVVIYPPVNVGQFKPADAPGKYYLVFGRQVAYKRLDLAVDAFNELGLPLVVAGVGEEIAVQQARSGPNIRYVGRVEEADKGELYRQAIALVFPAEEDFGIVPVEAMAAGRPVIAYGRGGATESVVEGQTGVFFAQQTPEALVEAVRQSQTISWDSAKIRARAKEFDEPVFAAQIKQLVDEQFEAFAAKRPGLNSFTHHQPAVTEPDTTV